jgi:protein-S-isoprenylcysteine O-methyltransferase Ste14
MTSHSMAYTALTLFLLWVLAAPVLRATVQAWRTGDSGLRMTTSGRGPLQIWVGAVSTAGICAQAAAAVAALAGLRPLGAFDHGLLRGIGVVLALLGTLGTGVAQASMGSSWRLGIDESEHTELVVQGPFRFMRNPIYTTMFLTMLGIALVVPNLIALIGMVLLFVSMHLEVRAVEEPYLRRTHGAAYLRYASSVGRFLPGVGRIRGPRPGN